MSCSDESSDRQAEDRRREERRQEVRRQRSQGPPLALWIRILLFLVGWLLVLVGIAGLVLPGIQGIVTLIAGAAVLSLVSDMAFNLLRYLMRRWPKGWGRVIRFRRWAHRWLSRLDRSQPEAPADSGGDPRTPPHS